MLKHYLLNCCSCPFLVWKQLGGIHRLKPQLRRDLSIIYPEKNSVYWMCNPQWRRHVPGTPGSSCCSTECAAARFYVSPSTTFINSMVVKLEMCWSFILQFLLIFLPSVQKFVGMKMHLAASVWRSWWPCLSQHEQSWPRGYLKKGFSSSNRKKKKGCVFKAQKKSKLLITQQ